MHERPAPDQPLWLRSLNGAGYDTRVREVREDAILLDRPAEYASFTEPQRLELIWASEATLFSLQVEIADDGDSWLARPLARSGPAQRRRHARIHVTAPLMLVCEGIAIDGEMQDISEAALRVHLPLDTRPCLTPGALVHLDVLVDHEPFVLRGRVQRLDRRAAVLDAVIAFDIDGDTVHRLRRALFFEQLRLDLLES